MKRIKYLILSIISIATLFSCSDMDDIRNDIDDLNARLDKLEAQLPQINQDIANYQGILNGQILILGYTVDWDRSEDENGNENLEYTIELSNGTTISVHSNKVPNEDIPVMSIGADGNWYYTLNGETKPLLDGQGNPVSANPTDGKTPEFSVDENGQWIYRYDDGEWLDGIGVANPVQGSGDNSIFESVTVSEDGNSMTFTWNTDAGQLSKEVALFGGLSLTVKYGDVTPVVFGLGQVQKFEVVQEGVENIVIETTNWGIELGEKEMTVTAPKVNVFGKDYEDKLVIKIFSKEGYCRLVTIPVKLLNSTIDKNSAIAWQNFLSGTDNVLLDYSYAGYNYGETVPADGFSLGYTVYNVKDVMEKNSLSARQAFEKILDDNKLIRKTNTSATNATARILIYFPAGEYNLQDNTTRPLPIFGGNFVIKGDGPDKTKLVMTSHIGTDEASTGAMISIQHSNSPRNINNSKSLGNITKNASKGDFTVYGSFSGITSDSWVQLRLRSNDDSALKRELGPLYNQKTAEWSITKVPGMESNGSTEDGNGIRIIEFHKVKSATSTSVTFYDPIMSDIDASIKDYNGGWEIREYKCYENVGIEDLAFVGNAPTPYYHHGENAPEGSVESWMYDSSYKPVIFMRVVNSWIRNVRFTSVSEAVSFDQSALCSAYNITIDGVRGHSAVRAQESTRVFIGKVRDESSESLGYQGKGQWHGCGVSKPSIGTVIWNTTWGSNACFESHATQPRATLFDNCSGGLVRYHAGGAVSENPNHLRDLTIWNLNVTGTTTNQGTWNSDFKWWDAGNDYWKIYPPIVVGVNGVDSDFFTDEENQLTYEESTGIKVTPESLYEAQLQKRLGYVPAWLNALK